MQLHRLRPILQVVDVERSIAFYTTRLGFHLDHSLRDDDGHPFWAQLARDNVRIMLSRGHDHAADGSDIPLDHSHGHRDTLLYLDTDDVVAVRQDLLARGAEPSEPCVTSYQMKEIYLQDPDGFTIVLAQETAEPPTEQQQ